MVIFTELFSYGFDKKVLRTRIIFKAVITLFVIFTDKKLCFTRNSAIFVVFSLVLQAELSVMGPQKAPPPPGHHTWKSNIFWQEGPHPPHVKRCHFNLDFLLTKHQYTLAASFEVTKSLQQENESGFLHDLSFPQT